MIRAQSRRLVILALLLLIGIPLAVLVVAIAREAFWPKGEFQLQVFADLFAHADLRQGAINTLIVVAAVTVLSTVLGCLIALATTKLPMKSRRLLQSVQYLPLTIPAFVGAIGWVFLAAPRAGWLNIGIRSITGGESGPLDINTVWGVIWVSTLYVTPFVFAIMVGALERTGSETFEAYVSNGTPPPLAALRMFTGVLRPALIGALILAVAESLVQFSVPLILNYDVLTTHLYHFVLHSNPIRTDMAAVLALFLLLVGGGMTMIEVTIIARRRFTSISGKGLGSSTWNIGRGWAFSLKALCVSYVFVAVVLPVGGLLMVSLMPYWTPDVDWSKVSLANFAAAFDSPSLRRGLLTSLQLATVTALVVAILGTAISVIRSNPRNGRLANALFLVASFPLAVPGLVLGLGGLIVYLNGPIPLYGTLLGVVIVYVLHYLPLGLRNIQPVVMQVGSEMQESAQISGSHPSRVFKDVTLPLIAPGVAAASIIVFVFALREFPMSSLLSSATFKVAAVYLVDTFQTGVFPQVAVLALMFCAIGMAAVFIALFFTSRVKFGQRSGTRRRVRRVREE